MEGRRLRGGDSVTGALRPKMLAMFSKTFPRDTCGDCDFFLRREDLPRSSSSSPDRSECSDHCPFVTSSSCAWPSWLDLLLLLHALPSSLILSELRLRLRDPREKPLLRRPWSCRDMRETLLGLTECPGPSNTASRSWPYCESLRDLWALARACCMSIADAPSV